MPIQGKDYCANYGQACLSILYWVTVTAGCGWQGAAGDVDALYPSFTKPAFWKLLVPVMTETKFSPCPNLLLFWEGR